MWHGRSQTPSGPSGPRGPCATVTSKASVEKGICCCRQWVRLQGAARARSDLERTEGWVCSADSSGPTLTTACSGSAKQAGIVKVLPAAELHVRSLCLHCSCPCSGLEVQSTQHYIHYVYSRKERRKDRAAQRHLPAPEQPARGTESQQQWMRKHRTEVPMSEPAERSASPRGASPETTTYSWGDVGGTERAAWLRKVPFDGPLFLVAQSAVTLHHLAASRKSFKTSSLCTTNSMASSRTELKD